MPRKRLRSEESGQSTVEWVGLVLLVSLVVAGFGAIVGIGLPGAALAHAVVDKLVCAVEGGDRCGGVPSELAIEYGTEIAEAIQDHVPDLLYEESMRELPVDYRDCREDSCAAAARTSGPVSRTLTGLPATAFVHVVDCRPESVARTEAEGLDCSAERHGQVYIQYWLYFPDSQTKPFGNAGYHRDDWESFQVRFGEPATLARASSHRSYNYDGGIDNWLSDAGIDKKRGWGRHLSTYHLSAGSHAGHVDGDRNGPMHTAGSRLTLVPIEPIAATGLDDDLFAVTPPWLKNVWRDPEHEGTN
jgi:hypothetical protein